MKQIRKRLTYANVMSSIAMFLLLGGATAFASNQLGKNSVGSKQLKKNAVTAAKIKKNAVSGAKVKNQSLTGADIDLAKLGTVPSATHAASADTATNAAHATSADTASTATNATSAGHATTADTATNAVNATNFSRYSTSGLVKASTGPTVTLGKSGPFTITGHCEDEGAGEFNAWVSLETSQAHSFMESKREGHTAGDFEPGEEVEIGDGFSDSEPDWYDPNDDYEAGWTAASPDGSLVLKGLARVGVHVFGADCAFLVNWTNDA